MKGFSRIVTALAVASALGIASSPALGQSRIRAMPGYDNFAAMSQQIPRSVKLGSVNAEWADDSQSFEYTLDGTRLRFDLATMTSTEAPPRAPPEPASTPASPPAER